MFAGMMFLMNNIEKIRVRATCNGVIHIFDALGAMSVDVFDGADITERQSIWSHAQNRGMFMCLM